MPDGDARGRATSEQLRADIDGGRTGEKVAKADPATVPLGTDDEAAGHPPDPDALARLREREALKAPRTRPELATPDRNRARAVPLLPLAVVTALLAILAGLFVGAGLF